MLFKGIKSLLFSTIEIQNQNNRTDLKLEGLNLFKLLIWMSITGFILSLPYLVLIITSSHSNLNLDPIPQMALQMILYFLILSVFIIIPVFPLFKIIYSKYQKIRYIEFVCKDELGGIIDFTISNSSETVSIKSVPILYNQEDQIKYNYIIYLGSDNVNFFFNSIYRITIGSESKELMIPMKFSTIFLWFPKIIIETE